jgi:hypothetical protein
MVNLVYWIGESCKYISMQINWNTILNNPRWPPFGIILAFYFRKVDIFIYKWNLNEILLRHVLLFISNEIQNLPLFNGMIK